MEIPIKIVNEYTEMNTPGTIMYWYMPESEMPGGLNFICPCGCGGFGGVVFGEASLPINQGGGWQWNGNQEKPTVTPSILFNKTEGCGWHGYLTDGVFRSC